MAAWFRHICPAATLETLVDKFRDMVPMWLWPKIRVFYYVFSIAFVLLAAFGVIMLLLGLGKIPA
jgi:hypothetical protein